MTNGFQKPHVVAVPFLALGHSIPFLDLARLLASHGLTVSYVTTPANVARLQRHVDEAVNNGLDIRLVVLPTPAVEGLPEGCENTDLLPSASRGLIHELVTKLQHPFHTWLDHQFEEETHQQSTGPPVCLIYDMFIGWAMDTAQKYNIPCFLFNTCGAFGISLLRSISSTILQNALEKEGEAEDSVVLSLDLPRPLRLGRHEVAPGFFNPDLSDSITQLALRRFQQIGKGSGILINSFHELESVYIQHLQKFTNKPVWAIGPVFPPKYPGGAGNVISARGKMADISEGELVLWLDSQSPRSVVYVSFGSQTSLSQQQTNALAGGLEASEQPFVWAIKVSPNIESTTSDSTDLARTYLPEGFVERTKKRGVVIWGWAPQLLVLSHPSVGAFMSHCGWNSTLESISHGVPMLAWPMFGDQHFNSKQIAELGAGIQFCQDRDGIPDKERVKEVVRMVLIEDEGKEIGQSTVKLKEMAGNAVKHEGSSAADLQAFVSEMHKLNIKACKTKSDTEPKPTIPTSV